MRSFDKQSEINERWKVIIGRIPSRIQYNNYWNFANDKQRLLVFTHINSPSVALILHMNNELWMNNWVEHYFRNPFSIDSIWIYHTNTISSQESELYITQIEHKLFLTNLSSKSIIWNPLYFQLISDIFSFLPCCLSFWKCIEI